MINILCVMLGIFALFFFVFLVVMYQRKEFYRNDCIRRTHDANNDIQAVQSKYDHLEIGHEKLIEAHAEKCEQFILLHERYTALFCEKPGCNNLKYYKFKYCSKHVTADAGALDAPALEGERPTC